MVTRHKSVIYCVCIVASETVIYANGDSRLRVLFFFFTSQLQDNAQFPLSLHNAKMDKSVFCSVNYVHTFPPWVTDDLI